MDPAAYSPGQPLPADPIERRRYTRAAASRGDIDVFGEVAVPLMREVRRLIDAGDTRAADEVLVHAVHDGVRPVDIVQAFAQVTQDG